MGSRLDQIELSLGGNWMSINLPSAPVPNAMGIGDAGGFGEWKRDMNSWKEIRPSESMSKEEKKRVRSPRSTGIPASAMTCAISSAFKQFADPSYAAKIV